MMAIYRINTSWGEPVHFAADLTQASAPLYHVDDDTLEIGGSTQYQTADARHCAEDAARLYMSVLGQDFYREPDFAGSDDEAIEDAIVSVETLE